MKFLSKKLIKKLSISLGVFAIIACTNTLTFAASSGYVFYLPKYQGTIQDTGSGVTKYNTNQSGYNDNYEITGGYSYALDYYMSNSNNERRGEYKTIDSGFRQSFTNWGEGGGRYVYYLTSMNYSSVSVEALARGKWSADSQ